MRYATEEASYLRLGDAWKQVHRQDGTLEGWKVLAGLATLLLLTPVMGMVLVFAVLPALPLALLVGSVLGPMNLFNNGETDDEDAAYEVWEQRQLAAAHVQQLL